MARLSIGDRVTRPLYLDDGTWTREGDRCLTRSPMRYGTICGVEDRGRRIYAVRWDDGEERRGYLAHGLNWVGA